jgi:hypothetical protein
VFGAPVTSSITPVPFPSPDEEWLNKPTADEVRLTVSGVVSAAAPPGGLTEVQRAVLNAHVASMTEHPVDVTSVPAIGPKEFAEGLRYRNEAFRERMVQIMLLAEMLLVPIPREVSERVETYAAWLGVGDDMIKVVRRIANGSLGLALIDFQRSGYFERMLAEPPEHLHTTRALDEAWEAACSDDELYARWAALDQCPEGSLGLGVWRFYRARGFAFPGRPESAPPLLAQHDWIHVLADYGSTVESEIEVFGLISRANDDPGAFSLLAMVLGLFETGYLYGAAKGFFEYDRGHLSRDVDRMAVRLADATYRGAILAKHVNDSGRGSKATDLLAVDWFAHADRPIDDVRAEYGLPPRSEAAIAAGSTTPWEHGGISPFQYAHGREVAEAEGREYESFGAEPA